MQEDNSLKTAGAYIWGLWHQKQVSQAGINNCIPQNTVGCNYLSLSEIPASGTEVLICQAAYVHVLVRAMACRLSSEGNHRSTVDSPHKGLVTRYIFFDVSLNKRLNKQARRRWFETPSRSLWRRCNDNLRNLQIGDHTFPVDAQRNDNFHAKMYAALCDSVLTSQWRYGYITFQLVDTSAIRQNDVAA